MQVELSGIVIGSVVDRKVITMNYEPKCYCHRSMSARAQDGVSLIRYI